MGRYYDGDINGKFWFGVQSSDAADRFGQRGQEPSYIEYYYDRDDLDEVEAEIIAIILKLGGQFEKMEEFFSQNNGYNDKMLDEVEAEIIAIILKLGGEEFFSQNNGYNDKMLNEAGIDIALLSDYADYCLGIKIRDCIKEIGGCSFTAEL